MFNKEAFHAQISQLINTSEENTIKAEFAISPEYAGVKMYDDPLIGYADAADPLFVQLKKPEAVGPQMMLPDEWLPGAKSVISIFLPFSKEVRESNRSGKLPSDQWLHARVEGQQFIGWLTAKAADILRADGYSAATPCIDQRFKQAAGKEMDYDASWQGRLFTSNWSERHTAFVAGLGTFGLSKGLITEKGMAGRFTSIITTAEIPADIRPYTDIYEYCIMCGACASNCPVNAISLEKGKDHMICSRQVDLSRELCAPRYGCGKCQVSVPCEFCRPDK